MSSFPFSKIDIFFEIIKKNIGLPVGSRAEAPTPTVKKLTWVFEEYIFSNNSVVTRAKAIYVSTNTTMNVKNV